MNHTRIFSLLLLLSLLLAGCGIGRTPAPLPTVVLDRGELPTAAPPAAEAPAEAPADEPAWREVAASGVVAPARQVQIAAAQGGRVEEVSAARGEQVQAGQALVRLAGAEGLAAAVETARTELLAAQQGLQELHENAGQARAEALLRLANANKALERAETIRGYRQYRNGSDAMIAGARADVILANDALSQAQTAYNAVSGLGDDSVTKAGAISALGAAQKAYDRAVANLNYLLAMPNPVDVNLAEAELQAALAEVDAAQREVDALENGPDPAALALAEQRVRNAEAQLAAAEASLGNLEITAPFDGTVAALEVDPGAWVAPGQPLLTLADLAHLQIQTTDLSERDVPGVAVGQPVRVTVKALGVDLIGRVAEISPLADTLGGDVVYAATIDLLDPPPAALRAGMTVDVAFLVE